MVAAVVVAVTTQLAVLAVLAVAELAVKLMTPEQ
jgi:hypothetical protein